MRGHSRTLLLTSTGRAGGAEMASALAFLLLDRGRRRFSADALRVLADAALLSPCYSCHRRMNADR